MYLVHKKKFIQHFLSSHDAKITFRRYAQKFIHFLLIFKNNPLVLILCFIQWHAEELLRMTVKIYGFLSAQFQKIKKSNCDNFKTVAIFTRARKIFWPRGKSTKIKFYFEIISNLLKDGIFGLFFCRKQ